MSVASACGVEGAASHAISPTPAPGRPLRAWARLERARDTRPKQMLPQDAARMMVPKHELKGPFPSLPQPVGPPPAVMAAPSPTPPGAHAHLPNSPCPAAARDLGSDGLCVQGDRVQEGTRSVPGCETAASFCIRHRRNALACHCADRLHDFSLSGSKNVFRRCSQP